MGSDGEPSFIQTKRWANCGLGYLPDLTDIRDHSVCDLDFAEELKEFLKKLESIVEKRSKRPPGYQSPYDPKMLVRAYEVAKLMDDGSLSGQDIDDRITAFCGEKRNGSADPRLSTSVNLGDTGYLTAVENQGPIGSCTAHAVVGLAEYLIKAATYVATDLSRLFLYKTTRNLMGVLGDTGAYIRTTIKAMATFGIPPENAWAYDVEAMDCEPEAYQYSFAANFKAVTYKRIDGNNYSSKGTLLLLLHVLAAGFPVAFGFPVYESIGQVTQENPIIPAPGAVYGDQQIGGHAVLAVGYNPTIEYIADHGVDQGGPTVEKGALIIKNSWGEDWGDGGFAYMPFKYVTAAMAMDFWTVFNSLWMDEKRFEDQPGD